MVSSFGSLLSATCVSPSVINSKGQQRAYVVYYKSPLPRRKTVLIDIGIQ
jgi:hypothetical protein